ncbi:MAG: AAA family ATPase [Candidatus Aerophobus sp.]|nr:MAG: AAA family ATPase [Candidatus Aerophobus sp.]
MEHHRTVLITGSIVNQSPGQILGDIAHALHASTYPATTRRLFNSIIDHLKTYLAIDAPHFILIDEAHFLAWDTFELLRTIHDEVRTGIVYLGMPRLLSEMKRNRRFLWDQILSRLSVSCSINTVTKGDVKLLVDSIFPDLPKSCLEYLYEKALGPGKFRSMMELLNRVVHIHKIEQIPVTATLIKKVDEQF